MGSAMQEHIESLAKGVQHLISLQHGNKYHTIHDTYRMIHIISQVKRYVSLSVLSNTHRCIPIF